MKRHAQMKRTGTPRPGTFRKIKMRGVGKPKREWLPGPIVTVRSIYGERANRNYTRKHGKQQAINVPMVAALMAHLGGMFAPVWLRARHFLEQSNQERAQRLARRSAARGT